jgi:hypothetical protein
MLAATGNNHNNDYIPTINWNDIVNQDTRSMDDAYLGKVKGLYEPFIVLEKGLINKEKFYIPKSLIENSSGGELHFSITEQEAKDIYRRKSPPTEDETKQIETITENRIMASRNDIEITEQKRAGEGEAEQRQRPRTEEKKMMIVNKFNEPKENITTTTSSLRSISMPRIDKEEITKKLIHSASKVKKIVVSVAKIAKEKIKEVKDVAEERKAENDAKKISKMGNLALQFSSSFDNIVSEISLNRTYAEQEQIYKGFIRLLGLQGELLVARKKFAIKLKDSVKKAIATNNNIKQSQLTQDKQQQPSKVSALPVPEPRLPDEISTSDITTTEEGKIKSNLR